MGEEIVKTKVSCTAQRKKEKIIHNTHYTCMPV